MDGYFSKSRRPLPTPSECVSRLLVALRLTGARDRVFKRSCDADILVQFGNAGLVALLGNLNCAGFGFLVFRHRVRTGNGACDTLTPVTIGSVPACRTTCQIEESNTRAGAASRALG